MSQLSSALGFTNLGKAETQQEVTETPSPARRSSGISTHARSAAPAPVMEDTDALSLDELRVRANKQLAERSSYSPAVD